MKRFNFPPSLLNGAQSFNSNDVPKGFMRTINPQTGTVTLPIGVDVLFAPAGTFSEVNANENNFFEQASNHLLRYTHPKPAYFQVNWNSTGRLNSGGHGGSSCFVVNGATSEENRMVFALTQADVHTRDFKGVLRLQKGDVFGPTMQCTTSNRSHVDSSITLATTFGGWLTSPLLGSELFANPDLTSLAGFTGNSANVTNPSAGEIVATATGAASSVDVAVSGLTIGERYRLVIPARRGAQGTQQAIDSVNFGTITSAPVLLTLSEEFVFDIVATAVSGNVNVVINTSGAIGDEVILNSQVSIKEYL